jgi:hypothetical protein
MKPFDVDVWNGLLAGVGGGCGCGRRRLVGMYKETWPREAFLLAFHLQY